jgi:hypothetical protein
MPESAYRFSPTAENNLKKKRIDILLLQISCSRGKTWGRHLQIEVGL